MDRRLVAAILAAVAIAVTWWSYPVTQVEDTAVADVEVDGPDGRIWNGTVVASPATAFHALLAASEAGGFEVEWSGPAGSRYVSSIGGHDDRNGGWCIQVDGEDSPVSGDSLPVRDGQTVRWYWTDDQCDRF